MKPLFLFQIFQKTLTDPITSMTTRRTPMPSKDKSVPVNFGQDAGSPKKKDTEALPELGQNVNRSRVIQFFTVRD